MALTQISTGGIKDDAVTDAKLPANSVGNSEMKDDAVGVAELSATGTAGTTTYLRGDNSWQTVTSSDTTYAISCVDGDNSDEEKIRLTAGGSGSGTDDVVLEAGTGLSVARSGDKITFTNTVSDTNTNVLAGGTITGDVIFDNATNAGKDLTWDMSDNALEFKDSVLATFGTDGDQAIWHTGSTGYIRNSTGGLVIRNDAFSIKDDGESETMLTAVKDGAVTLYYDNAIKCGTTSGGIYVDGILEPLANNTQNIGKTDYRWHDVFIGDGGQLSLGAANDLKIYHDGTDSNIINTTGNLYITTDGGNISLMTNSSENAVKCYHNGAVELRYDNAVRLQTTASGVEVTKAGDSASLTIKGGEGEPAVLFLYSDEGDDNADKWRMLNENTGEFKIQNYTSGSWETNLKAVGDGATVLYHDNALKLATNNDGVTFDNDATQMTLYLKANDDLKGYIFAGPGDEIGFKTASNEWGVQVDSDAEVALYYDGSEKVRTKSWGVEFLQDFQCLDSKKGVWGTDDDLSIYHDGSNGYIDNNTGELKIETSIFNVRTDNGNENSIYCTYDEGVKLYYDGSEKFRTTAVGAQITGGGNRCFQTLSTHSSGGELVNFDNGVSGHYGALVVSGGEIDRECRLEAAYGDSLLTFWTNNGEHFRIANNGDLTATDTSIGSNSDSRLKKNIANYTYDLAKFKQFQPKTFDWINKEAHGNKTGQRGFIAQDLESIDAKLVGSIELDPEHLDRDLVGSDHIAKTAKLGENDAMYISVINQLISKIETLETKVAALEAA